MRTLFTFSALIMITLFSCKKAFTPALQETGTSTQTKETSPALNSKTGAKKYKPSDWTIKPFGYDFSVKNLDLMGFKSKGC